MSQVEKKMGSEGEAAATEVMNMNPADTSLTTH